MFPYRLSSYESHFADHDLVTGSQPIQIHAGGGRSALVVASVPMDGMIPRFQRPVHYGAHDLPGHVVNGQFDPAAAEPLSAAAVQLKSTCV